MLRWHLDPSVHLLRGNHVHAARQPSDDIHAQLIGRILRVAIAELSGGSYHL
jgi:hypothetical protein